MDRPDNSNTVNSPWLTAAEAASYAKIHRNTLDKWRNDGLPFSMVRGSIRIHTDDLDEFIRKHQARKIARRHGVRL